MRSFVGAMTVALATVVIVGGAVVVATGSTRDGDVSAAQGSVLTQVEEDLEPEPVDEPADTALSPIEQLLEALAPSAESTSLPSAQRVVLSRDPFRPVVPETAVGDDGTDGDGTDGDGTDGDGTDGGDDDVCTGGEQETVCDGVVVTLDGFTDEGEAIISADGTRFTVVVDMEFAESFRVLAINEPCVTLLFGDEAFSICTGATVLK